MKIGNKLGQVQINKIHRMKDYKIITIEVHTTNHKKHIIGHNYQSSSYFDSSVEDSCWRRNSRALNLENGS